jgi:hypothetical protein
MKTRTWFGALAVVLSLGLSSLAMAGDQGKQQGCSPLGTWIGSTGSIPSWIASNHGLTPNSGTIVLEVIGFDTTLGGNFPAAVKAPGTLRGTWEKIGPNRSLYTAIGFTVDEDANLVYMTKLSGYRTLSDDCNSMYIETALEIFLPTQNVLTDEAFLVIPLPPHYGARVTTSEPAMTP